MEMEIPFGCWQLFIWNNSQKDWNVQQDRNLPIDYGFSASKKSFAMKNLKMAVLA
jgi:hypothetical protein